MEYENLIVEFFMDGKFVDLASQEEEGALRVEFPASLRPAAFHLF